MTLIASEGALPHLKSGSSDWSPRLRPRVDRLVSDLADIDEGEFARVLGSVAKRRQESFIRGVEKYRAHPWRRDAATEAKILWKDGTTTLLDYSKDGACGQPVLIVPSLINRAYILDLFPERSLVKFLVESGFRVYMIDWNEPGSSERGFSLDDYIAGRLSAALSTILKKAGPPVLVGYCLGGVLSLAAGVLRERDVKGLVLLATPWDFHKPDTRMARAMKAWRPLFEDAIRLYGIVPAEIMQCFFSMIDPGEIERKFRAFAGMAQDSQKARSFVGLEDWTNDGIPLPTKVARQCLYDLCVDNSAAKGEWSVAGEKIRAPDFKKPALVIAAKQDRIVPLTSALAVADEMPHAEKLLLPTGHVGMLVGARARSSTYAPMANWIEQVA
ncbi:alpha/beta hydrolase [Alphaproteobacteria bacterium]|nr:alpha/beta hydrolase [Alphaproteobacteria bacterium]